MLVDTCMHYSPSVLLEICAPPLPPPLSLTFYLGSGLLPEPRCLPPPPGHVATGKPAKPCRAVSGTAAATRFPGRFAAGGICEVYGLGL